MTLQFCTQGPWGAPLPKKFHPIFLKFLRVVVNFFFIWGPPRPIRENNCKLYHFPETKFRNFAENRFFSSYSKSLFAKNVGNVRDVPLYNWAKVQPRMLKNNFLRDLKKIGQPKPRNSFFPQNGGENYFRFQFSAVFLFSTLDLVVLAKTSRNVWPQPRQ